MKTVGLVVAALLGAGSVAWAGVDAEAELKAKLPAIFAKAAAHYRALDAAATPLMKGGKDGPCVPYGFDRKAWKLDMRPVVAISAGSFPGSLWHLYEATGDVHFRDRATVWTELFAPNAKVTGYHDVGQNVLLSYGNARRLLKTDKYDGLLSEMAATLCRRFNKDLGFIRSWGPMDEKNAFLVVPDSVMTLELLEEVEKAGGGGQWNFDSIARSHADATMRYLFRPDGGCRHIVDFDVKTKCVRTVWRGKGASCMTAWSCGQSKSVYGYTMMYRVTKDVRYLDFAKKLADYAIGHPNMPADGIPYWDYGAPGEERDSAAAAILASALLELSQHVGAADGARYRAFAVKQLRTLSSSAYFSEGDEVGHFLLRHGVGDRTNKAEVDAPLAYGDCYYLEALVRFGDLVRGNASGKKGVVMDIAKMKSKFAGEDPRVPGFVERHFKTPIRVMVIGAHPDDPDVRCSGLARRLVEAGHRVRFVSLTNGEKGHQFMEAKDLAVRRYKETRNVVKTLGIEDYIVGDTPDCELQPTLEERKKVTKVIREFGPNIIITHRPNDYHCDHRATATLVQDATYLIGVPLWCPDVPVPETIPTVFFMGDRFTQPTAFRPDFVIDVSQYEDVIFRTFACHESQMFEWLVPEHGFSLADVPPADDAEGRLAFVRKSAKHLVCDFARVFDQAVAKAYPGQSPEVVEVYEMSEYGRRPVKAERDLLASLGGRWIDSTESKWTQVK